MFSIAMFTEPSDRFVDQRRHPRYGFQVHVTCRNVNTVFSGVTRNVSRGGCFIQTESPLPPGTTIWLEFSFTDIPVNLGSIQGRVAWRTRSDDSIQGMGIAYENVPDVVQDLMTEFIDHVKNQNLPENVDPGIQPV